MKNQLKEQNLLCPSMARLYWGQNQGRAQDTGDWVPNERSCFQRGMVLSSKRTEHKKKGEMSKRSEFFFLEGTDGRAQGGQKSGLIGFLRMVQKQNRV